MKAVVCPHTLELGGSQLNAIELAAAIRDRDHEVIVFARPGMLAERITELGLELVISPRPRGRPSPRVIAALTELVRDRKADVVHGYEWTTILEAYWGPRVRSGVPVAATVMSMSVAPFIPSDLPLVVGTEQIAAAERRTGRRDVTVIEPPVDLEQNAPGAVDPREFRRRHRIDPGALTIVAVSRLAAELKLEGLEAAIDAVATLSEDHAIQLVIAGDGPARSVLEERAAAANRRAGRRVVVLTGELSDPRPAYAAADVCLGMGGSALRAMAFAKPLIVQGERGFWKLLSPASQEAFLNAGWYGVGSGTEAGTGRLIGEMAPLIGDASRRAAFGAHARELVVARFGLDAAADRQLEIYSRIIAGGPIAPRRRLAGGGRSARGLVVHRVGRALASARGRGAADDFNAQPLAASASAGPG
jgi:L-malate glycosyltransferase